MNPIYNLLRRFWRTVPRWGCLLPIILLPLTACVGEPDYRAEHAGNLLAGAPVVATATGQVYGTHVATSVWAAVRVMAQAPSTFLLADPSQTKFIFAAPTACKDGNCQFFFSMVDVAKFSLMQYRSMGNITDGGSFSKLVTAAEQQGFRVISPDEMPVVFRLALMSALNYLATGVSTALTDFLAAPTLPENWQEPVFYKLPTKG